MEAPRVMKNSVDSISKQSEAINFQISMTLYAVIAGILVLIVIGIFLLIGIGILDIVLVIIAAVKANAGEKFRYPLTIRFIR